MLYISITRYAGRDVCRRRPGSSEALTTRHARDSLVIFSSNLPLFQPSYTRAPLMKGRTTGLFQSTRHAGATFRKTEWKQWRDISIRATRGATVIHPKSTPLTIFQSTHHAGAMQFRAALGIFRIFHPRYAGDLTDQRRSTCCGFYPRPRGRDMRRVQIALALGFQSTRHAGATKRFYHAQFASYISIHAPTRGAT